MNIKKHKQGRKTNKLFYTIPAAIIVIITMGVMSLMKSSAYKEDPKEVQVELPTRQTKDPVVRKQPERKEKERKREEQHPRQKTFKKTVEESFKRPGRYDEIVAVHPDCIKIVNSQMFDDYINNLSTQQFRDAMITIESGTTEEVVDLITRYKRQASYQHSFRVMMVGMVKNYTGPNRKSRATKAIQDWIDENEDTSEGPKVINLRINKTDTSSVGQSYLVEYTIAKGANEQKFLYEVNYSADKVRTVSFE